MYSTPIKKGPVHIDLTAARIKTLPEQWAPLTQLTVDTTAQTYTLSGDGKTHSASLPKRFIQEIEKMSRGITADLAWALFQRFVLEQPPTPHPSTLLNSDLSQALVKNAGTPLSPEKQSKLETILLDRYLLLEVLLITRRHLSRTEEKQAKKERELHTAEKELNNVQKTLEQQQKHIQESAPETRKPALMELEGMKTHYDFLSRHVRSIKVEIGRLIAQHRAVTEEGLGGIPGIHDTLDPHAHQRASQLHSSEKPFLDALHNAIKTATHDALTLLNEGEL